ncbi:unnamed protein product [Miscanthus lutarioriparius]|uniref:Uncharacterized protein n=1 Tax=Miscanthus lutarioriparius TaxID=422564 RepID=A0A811QYE5_9POAL|nr:unnamed protein product [Miscanthus lutarioriparius]
MACFQVHKLLPLPPAPYCIRITLLLMTICLLLSCSSEAKVCTKCCDADDDSAGEPVFKFSHDSDKRYLIVLPLRTMQEPSLFISPRIPPKGSLEPSAPTWTTITYSVIVLAMCKYILFAI